MLVEAAWPARCILVQQSWEDGIGVVERLVLPELGQAAMGKRSLLRWPTCPEVFDPMAHARVGYHTSGAAGERGNVMNQAGQFSARGPVHTMVQLSGFTLYGGKQMFKRSGLPHEGSAWVLTRPQEIVCLAKGDQLTGYTVKLICFVDSLLLLFC